MGSRIGYDGSAMSDTITIPTILGIATVFATIAGPIAAVWATRWMDHGKERYQRRLDVFRALMRSRRTWLSPEYVGALNLVEVEFYDDQKVIAAWKELLKWFEAVAGAPNPDERQMQRLNEEGQRLRVLLMDAIAHALKINIPQLDIFHGGYNPELHGQIENEQHSIRRLFADIANGKKAFPVLAFTRGDLGRSPPPPQPDLASRTERKPE